MSYVRVTQSLQDKGILVRPEEVDSVITDRSKDWYCSPYEYGDEVLEYFKNNGDSIKGYTGEAWTSVLYWDIDYKGNFDKARDEAAKILIKLEEYDLIDGCEVFFSGNKGFHIFLHTEQKFMSYETSKICYNLAIDAGIDMTPVIIDGTKHNVFDTSVYNTTRIFRIVNTKHQSSDLYKIKLSEKEFNEFSEEQIKKLAKNPRRLLINLPEPVNAQCLLDKYGATVLPNTEAKNNVVSIASDTYENFDPMTCPPGKRRCIYVLENGYFGPGERHNACLRLAAHYRAGGIDRDSALELLNQALEKRAEHYPDAKLPNPKDTKKIIEEVYSEGWRGGAFTCKSGPKQDFYLVSKCDCGHGPCGDEEKDYNLHVVDVQELCNQYIIYGNDAQKEYPKSGLEWLDDKVRIRPRNFSVIAGAAGSGKTSLVIQMMEYFNTQNIPNIFFSMDMANTSIFEKLGARYTDYSAREIEDAFNIHTRDIEIMKEVMTAIKAALPITYFDFSSALESKSIEHTIRSINERLPEGRKLQVGIIDYAGRLLGESDNAYANSTHNATIANDIAKRCNIHLMYISQISREKGDHTSPLYTARVAKESGAWEENSTFVLTCWRPFGDNRSDQDHYFHIYIGKNRSGKAGEGVFWWDGKRGDVRALTKDEFKKYCDLCDEFAKEAPPAMFTNEEFVEEQKNKQADLAKKDRRFNGDNEEDKLDESSKAKVQNITRFSR